MWKKEEIAEKIQTNDEWLCRGIIAIYNKQTPSEKSCRYTNDFNGVGFNSFDSKFLSDMALLLIEGRKLSYKQLIASRKKMVKYSGQLCKIANKEI